MCFHYVHAEHGFQNFDSPFHQLKICPALAKETSNLPKKITYYPRLIFAREYDHIYILTRYIFFGLR